jgi:AAA family ATP:ADP antiporter
MSTETPSSVPEFSKWRRYLWPVHSYELKKLIPMLLIFFFISFDYNVLRTLKDSLLITAKSSGAEVIPFVKVWAMFPGAILMTLLFTWLSNRLSRETVFYVMMSIFLAYFFVFTFFLYPIRDFIHPHATADALELALPVGFKGAVAMFRYWSFTIFYVLSELWGSIVLFVLFWGFANQVTKLGEAKRFYGLFGVGANLSGVFAGQASVYCCNFTRNGGVFPVGADAWHQSLAMIVSLVLVAGFISLALFRWMNKQVLTDPRFYDASPSQPQGKTKEKFSLKQTFTTLLNSPYLLCIALIVISYNMVINLTEVIWKHQVRELYPNPNDYTLYMNQIVSIIGFIATFTSLFVSGNSIRKRGWTFTALITPVIILITSLGFFSFFFLKKASPEPIISLLGSFTPLMIVVFFGSAQNILSRAAKYSVFDATKEMAFVPLSAETKLIGKASIDGVCSRFGKSGGAFVHQTLLLFFSTLTFSAPYVAVVLLVVTVVWVLAIKTLGRQFNELSAQMDSGVVGSLGESVGSRLTPGGDNLNTLPEHGILQQQQAI